MKTIGCFSEMKIFADDGSIKNSMVEEINYDIDMMVNYLKEGDVKALCARHGIDCVTGEEIMPSISVLTDGEYYWCDFLPYHIEKYNIHLPDDFVAHVNEKQKTEK